MHDVRVCSTPLALVGSGPSEVNVATGRDRSRSLLLLRCSLVFTVFFRSSFAVSIRMPDDGLTRLRTRFQGNRPFSGPLFHGEEEPVSVLTFSQP